MQMGSEEGVVVLTDAPRIPLLRRPVETDIVRASEVAEPETESRLLQYD
jgi:hypothetical protein